MSHALQKRDMFRLVQKGAAVAAFPPFGFENQEGLDLADEFGALRATPMAIGPFSCRRRAWRRNSLFFFGEAKTGASAPVRALSIAARSWCATILNDKPFEAAKRRKTAKVGPSPGVEPPRAWAPRCSLHARTPRPRPARQARRLHRAAAPRNSNNREPRFRRSIPNGAAARSAKDRSSACAASLHRLARRKQSSDAVCGRHGAPREGRKPDPEKHWTLAPAFRDPSTLRCGFAPDRRRCVRRKAPLRLAARRSTPNGDHRWRRNRRMRRPKSWVAGRAGVQAFRGTAPIPFASDSHNGTSGSF